MAYYNINEMLRLTRIAKGISQEELSFGICSTVTLSGYENGKHDVRRKTYRRLMERMGRISDLHYAVYIDREGGLLEDRIGLESAYKSYDYELAGKYLQRMKVNADENRLTKQYVARAEAVLDYRMGRITAEEELLRIKNAIRLTVPEFEEYWQKRKCFPFIKEELLALMSLAGAYYECGRYTEAMSVNEWILYCLEGDYIEKQISVKISLSVQQNMTKIWQKQGEYENVLKIINECLEILEEADSGHLLAVLLASKAYNYIQLCKREIWSWEKMKEAKSLLRQAYYIAAARGDGVIMSRVENYYNKHFDEFIYSR